MNLSMWMFASALWFALSAGLALASEPAPEADVTETDASEASTTALLDLNRASQAELETLPGIGAKRAQAILEFRSAHGAFRSVSQLLRIKGIGRAMLRKLRPLVTVQRDTVADANTTSGGGPS